MSCFYTIIFYLLTGIFQGSMMPNGSPYILGGQVIIERVTRFQAGEYECVDNTTDGSTATKVVNVLCK